MSSVFLLSPANTAGKRAAILLNPGAEFELAKRLRNDELTLGEVFSFLSGLYFRGKLAYARKFAARTDPVSRVVLLGSIATRKYVEPLGEVFGERLVFPSEFVGRGDMSRGGLMLRSVLAEKELDYIPVATTVRKGARPPKLEKIRRG